MNHTSTQSPSNNKSDMMLLPGFSLADYEGDVSKHSKDQSRGSKNIDAKQAQKDQANSTSGQGKSVQKMINRMETKITGKIDYLTSQRNIRISKESKKGDYTVDVQK